MRRSFKVATVFAGTAALAGGDGPTALAATTQATTAGIKGEPCGGARVTGFTFTIRTTTT